MNLAFRYPVMFWNCACLISDAGGAESEEENFEETYTEEITYEDNGIESFVEEEDDDEEDEEAEVKTDKKKKKTKSVNYGKISSAIGKIKSSGITVAPPDINKSTFTFSPDIENNTIRYGLSGITKVGEELVKVIMDGRPYASINDFLGRVKINKPQMINLIKSGAFDCFGDRAKIMREYVESISDVKKRITLQNMKMLIDFNLIPEEYDMEKRVYNFTKYLKKMKLNDTYYGLDEVAFSFYSNHFDMDKLESCADTESGFKIKQTVWENYYKKHMDKIRPWVKDNASKLLTQVNDRLIKETWDKYCLGSISKWEMDSVSFYSHEHELANARFSEHGASRFVDIPEEPVIDRVIPIKGKQVPLLKLYRICGTVLDRDKSKKTVTLLTTDGVVTVKIFGAVFAQYDKQISERGADGKKHVICKSEFARGNKIIVCGVRDGDSFRAKKYSKTPWHLVERIADVMEDGTMIVVARQED